MSNKLKDFLHQHEVSKDAPYTHTSIIGGKYFIADNELDEFHSIYEEQIFKKNRNSFLTEKHLENYSKMCIDIDLRYSENGPRIYTLNFIKEVISYYQDGIRAVMSEEPNSAQLLAYVFEKDHPEYDEEKKVLKDGIHIMFPFTCINYRAQNWIRKNVIERLKDHPELSTCIAPIESVFDDSVIERNNWIMYGSKKNEKSQSYKLTYIFDLELDENTIPDDNLQLLKLLSIRKRFTETQTIVDTILQNEAKVRESIMEAETQLQMMTDTMVLETRQRKSKPYMKTLLSLLKKHRVNDYNEWFRIGALLYNEGEDNLDVWKEWSSTSTKYNESHCDKLWNETYPRYPEEKRIHLASLQKMAREDSPSQYFTEMEPHQKEDDLMDKINNSLRNTDYEFAQLIHHVLKDKYRFSRGKWYLFEGHQWKVIEDEPIQLKNDMIVIIGGLLFNYSSMLTLKIANLQAKNGVPLPEGDPLLVRRTALEKTIARLKSYTTKTTIVNESKLLFNDNNFFKELDMNIYLLGFNNGVYDLKEGKFRKGEPDDKISYSTGYDYTDKLNMETRKTIMDLFENSLPNANVREFMLTFFSSTLIGRNKNELFVNLEGTGGNGKGVITTLHDYAMGDYAGTLDNAYLTNVSSSQESHNSKLISVFKKRYVQVNEPPKGKILNQDFIKELTGNDKIQVRKAHAADPEICDVPMFKLVMLCNKMPRIEETHDGGFRRRYKGINFPNLFVDREPTKPNEFRADPNIKMKFKDDIRFRQQYMIILMEYLRRYIENGERITIPAEVDQNSRNILQTQDYYSEFVNERIEITKEEMDYVTNGDLYLSFKEYYSKYIGSSRGKLVSSTEFIGIMKQTFSIFGVEFRTNIKTRSVKMEKGFIGIKLADIDA